MAGLKDKEKMIFRLQVIGLISVIVIEILGLAWFVAKAVA